MYALFKIWEGGSGWDRACAELVLRFLMLGEEGMLLDERQERGSEVKIEFHSAMREAFGAPIIRMMGWFAHLSLPRARDI